MKNSIQFTWMFVILFSILLCHANVVELKKVDILFQTSRISAGMTVSADTWVKNRPVQVVIYSGDLGVVRDLGLSLDLYRSENRASSSGQSENSKINVHQGSIIKRKNRNVESNTKYTITFTPPSFLEPGEYTLVAAIHRTDSVVSVIKMSATATVSIPAIRKIQPGTSKSSENSEEPISFGDSLLEPTVLKSVLNQFTSLTDVCNYCSSTKTMMRACDDMFKTPFPKDFEIPENNQENPGEGNKEEQNQSDAESQEEENESDAENQQEIDMPPFTTSRICQLLELDTLLYKLQFKYISFEKATDSDLKTFVADVVTELRSSLQNKKYEVSPLIWSYPRWVSLLEEHFSERYKAAARAYDSAFGNRIAHPVFGNIAGSEVFTLSNIREWSTSIIELPRTEEFKENVAESFSVTLEFGRTKISVQDIFVSGLVLLRSQLNADAVSNWNDLTSSEKAATVSGIWEW
ncbi:hypothetical protein BKA69DRAFT_175004 [Paraphysoderma sedebokerense]|nr:hypothetical protein BKA69DRAFT_175004 [Paraphysoderma sedebokerense]